MASSKSFRASFLPSSFSFSSRPTTADADARDRPNSARRHRQTSSLDQQQQQHQPAPLAPGPPLNPHDHGYNGSGGGEPVPPPKLVRKSKTWSDRFTSLLPSLTSPSAEQPSILRKPVGASRDSPTSPPPPPPYDIHDSPGPSNVDTRKSFVPEGAWRPPNPPRSDLQYETTTAPFLQTPIPDSFMSEAPNVQIMPVIPPSPETKRATLTKPQPAAQIAAQVAAQRHEPFAEASSRPELQKQGKLIKENHDGKPPPGSIQLPKGGLPQPGMQMRHTSPAPDPRGRSVSAQVPPVMRTSTSNSRIASTPVNSRPVSQERSQSPTRGRRRRSWLPGGRSRSNSMEIRNDTSGSAWVMTDGIQAEYNASYLKNAEKVPELWNEGGEVLVFLYPKQSGCGPSFKVAHYTINWSRKFQEWLRAEQSPVKSRSRAKSFDGRGSLSVEDATRLQSPTSPPPSEPADGELRLYLPSASPSGQLAPPGHGPSSELDRLVAIRNMFAFLTGQPLVGTKANSTVFQAFLRISDLLREFEFISEDGNSFGPAVDTSMIWCMESLGLADCRNSREKTVEGLILGERMRSTAMYNEAFTHAAGKLQAITELQLPLFDLVSSETRNQLELAKNNIRKRQHNVNEHLEQFDFPSIFTGVAIRTSIQELRQVRFKIWRNSFNKMRQFVMSHYKSTFGSWPPKASSKKNPFAESGLNRLVLKVLYSDMCAIYDMLVDRTSLTTRTIDDVEVKISDDPDKLATSAMHNILSEFDRSKPPVLPPIPFDMPRQPSMASVLPTYDALPAKEQTKAEKKMKEHELELLLEMSYDYETSCIKLPFLTEFKGFEKDEARGKMLQDIVDQRIGYWLFIYAVIQSLPPLVVDAPGLKYSEGTEYFLCMPPMGNPPWFTDTQNQLYRMGDGTIAKGKLVVDSTWHSPEAIYYRSHCWLAAKSWDGAEGAEAAPPEEPAMSPLAPPRAMFQEADALVAGPPPVMGQSTPSPPLGGPQMAVRPRNLSPARHRGNPSLRASLVMGLAPVPVESPGAFANHYRSSSMGPPPLGGQLGSRSASAGNLAAMNSRDARPKAQSPRASPQVGGNSAATFDDILGGSDKKDAGKKKSRFF